MQSGRNSPQFRSGRHVYRRHSVYPIRRRLEQTLRICERVAYSGCIAASNHLKMSAELPSGVVIRLAPALSTTMFPHPDPSLISSLYTVYQHPPLLSEVATTFTGGFIPAFSVGHDT